MSHHRIGTIHALIIAITASYQTMSFAVSDSEDDWETTQMSTGAGRTYSSTDKWDFHWPKHYLMRLSGGPAWTRAGETQTIYLQNGTQQTYAADRTRSTMGNGGFFLGVFRDLRPGLEGDLGLSVGGTGSAKLSGSVWADANPAFNNYTNQYLTNTYQYSIYQLRVLVEGRLQTKERQTYCMLQPYVNIGLGVGFNRSYGYTETLNTASGIVLSPFQSSTMSTFTYTVGVGFQKMVTPAWQVGLGYEFANWGKSALEGVTAHAIHQGLSLSYLYTNELLFNITYHH